MADPETPAPRKVTSLTIVQLVMLIVGVSGTSGIGGAATVWARDAEQERRIGMLEETAVDLRKGAEKMRIAIAEVGVKVEAVKDAVNARNAETRGDIQELRKLVIQAIKDGS